jgi:hypothetical protein
MVSRGGFEARFLRAAPGHRLPQSGPSPSVAICSVGRVEAGQVGRLRLPSVDESLDERNAGSRLSTRARSLATMRANTAPLVQRLSDCGHEVIRFWRFVGDSLGLAVVSGRGNRVWPGSRFSTPPTPVTGTGRVEEGAARAASIGTGCPLSGEGRSSPWRLRPGSNA